NFGRQPFGKPIQWWTSDAVSCLQFRQPRLARDNESFAFDPALAILVAEKFGGKEFLSLSIKNRPEASFHCCRLNGEDFKRVDAQNVGSGGVRKSFGCCNANSKSGKRTRPGRDRYNFHILRRPTAIAQQCLNRRRQCLGRTFVAAER